MAYRRSRWESQDKRFRIEKKYYSFRALPMRPEIREKRAKRQNVTKETQAAVNRRLRAEKLSRLLMDNFAAGDWYLTCTYAEHPEVESVPKEFEKFKRKLRTIYKKAGVPMKYISVLENLTGAGRPHPYRTQNGDSHKSRSIQDRDPAAERIPHHQGAIIQHLYS